MEELEETDDVLFTDKKLQWILDQVTTAATKTDLQINVNKTKLFIYTTYTHKILGSESERY